MTNRALMLRRNDLLIQTDTLTKMAWAHRKKVGLRVPYSLGQRISTDRKLMVKIPHISTWTL
jgi:hypothetical protein